MPDRMGGLHTLQHSYLYLSENQPQIKKAAEKLARELEWGSEKKTGALLDASFFGSDGKNSISIDEIRRIKEFLSQKPFTSPRRIAIIENADCMTTEAQNALLKISEEPPPGALIIMLARREENFLPTILSRFQKIYFRVQGIGYRVEGNEQTKQVHELVKKFLVSPRKTRSEIIKEVVSKENEAEADITEVFLNQLMAELAKDMRRNTSKMREILEEMRVLGDYSLNRRLHLEKISSLWYN
jgi:DNA polymerase III delta prime subunit